MSIRQIGAVVAAFSFLFALSAAHAANNPREHLLLDQHWRFHLGDSPDVGKTLDYPEPSDLGKVRKVDLANWTQMEAGQVDAAQTQSGEQLEYVQPSFDTASSARTEFAARLGGGVAVQRKR